MTNSVIWTGPPLMQAMLLLILMLCASVTRGQVYQSDSGGGISCYVCKSVNGSNPSCRDPFDASEVTLVSQCSQGRKDQRGTYPARFCFKLKGVRKSDGLEVFERRCSVDPLINSVMKSHCGGFKISTDGVQQIFDGCVSMCRFDGCNSARSLRANGGPLAVLVTVAFAFLCFLCLPYFD